MCDCGEVHHDSYFGTAIERVVKEGASTARRERPVLFGFELGAVIPPYVVKLTHAEALYSDEDVVHHLLFRVSKSFSNFTKLLSCTP